MGLFNRSSTSDLTQMRDAEAKAASISRRNEATAAATGQPVRGIDADGWAQRAETFEAAADDCQRQINAKHR